MSVAASNEFKATLSWWLIVLFFHRLLIITGLFLFSGPWRLYTLPLCSSSSSHVQCVWWWQSHAWSMSSRLFLISVSSIISAVPKYQSAHRQTHSVRAHCVGLCAATDTDTHKNRDTLELVAAAVDRCLSFCCLCDKERGKGGGSLVTEVWHVSWLCKIRLQ